MLFIIQLFFLGMIIKEHFIHNNFIIVIIIVCFILTVFLGYRYLNLHHETYDYERFSIAIWVPIGAVLCYILNVVFALGSVLAAGIIGVLASFAPQINNQSNYLKKLPTAIYCGAFVGMSSAQITSSIHLVIAAGTITGILYMLSKNLFLGIGGKLGALAFAGVVIVTSIHWLYVG
ncbi:hypothetical protein BWR22_08310 [Lacinutrix venerupis]|uniref:Uncharacterized protein n=2 Tax=Lacinutrix venerupis TaxID=1486034 RepID=A0AAC9LP71_9FLAO|nr:hypothetical protein BWR22_08310 [Lacinutrix venerupis]